MGQDLVRLLLERVGDGFYFEKIAHDVLSKRGHGALVPLGGVADGGIDAFDEVLYQDEKEPSKIYQISIEKGVKGKVEKSINKLDGSGATNFHYATNQEISPSLRKELTTSAKAKGLTIDFTAIGDFVLTLGDFSNGLFVRYFGTLEQQQRVLPELSAEDKPLNDPEVVRTLGVFGFGEASKEARTRLVQEAILGVLSSVSKTGATYDLIGKILLEKYGSAIADREQIRAVVQDLAADDLVHQVSLDSFGLTSAGLAYVASVGEKANEGFEIYLNEILEATQKILGRRLVPRQVELLKACARKILLWLVRKKGIEIANGYSINGFEISKVDYPEVDQTLFEALKQTILSMLWNPNPVQAVFLRRLLAAYIGHSILRLDPAQSKLVSSLLAKRAYVLDTDVLIDLLVRESPEHSDIQKLVGNLAKGGCELIAYESSIVEMVEHAKSALKVFGIFGEALAGMPESAVEARVNNVFCKGFYNWCKSKRKISNQQNFELFMRAYVNPKDPRKLFCALLDEVVGKSIKWRSPEDEAIRRLESFEDLKRELYRGQINAHKAETRTSEEKLALAKADGEIFVDVMLEKAKRGGNLIIVSRSYAFVKAQMVLNVDAVVVSPYRLMGLVIGLFGSNNDDDSFVKSVFGGLFVREVERHWGSIKAVIEMGVELDSTSMARIIVELEGGLDEEIKRVRDKDQLTAEYGESVMGFLGQLAARGFTLHESVLNAIKAVEEKKVSKKDREALELGRKILNGSEKLKKKVLKYFGGK